MNKEKILITGGSGFVGTNIIDQLSEKNFEIFSLDIEEPKKIKENVKYVNLDIRSKDLKNVIEKIDPEIIIHLAAQSSVSISSKDPLIDNDINLNGSLNLLLNLLNLQSRHLIFFSTGGAIYGEEIGKKFNEDDTPKPLSPYGISKLNFENYLNYYSKLNLFNGKISIVRPSNIYGPWQNPKGEAGVVSIFSDRMLKGEDIIIFGNGNEYRDYIFIDDVIEFVYKLIELNLQGTFNVSFGETTKTKDIFKSIANIIGYNKPPILRNKREGDIFGIDLDNSKSIGLGWSPKINLELGLMKTIKFLKK